MTTKTLATFLLPKIPLGSYVVRGYNSAEEEGFTRIDAVFYVTDDLKEACRVASDLLCGSVCDHNYAGVTCDVHENKSGTRGVILTDPGDHEPLPGMCG